MHIVFADDDSELIWPQALEKEWPRWLERRYGQATVSLITNRAGVLQHMKSKKAATDLLCVDLFWGSSVEEGFDLIEQIRRISPVVPILVLTGKVPDAEMFRRCIDVGITQFFHKDDSLQKLVVCIDTQLAKAGPAIQEAARIKGEQNKDKRGEMASAWLKARMRQIPSTDLREALLWVEDTIRSAKPLSERSASTVELLNCIVDGVKELQARGVAHGGDRKLIANALFHLGIWNEAADFFNELLREQSNPNIWERLAEIAKATNDGDGYIDAMIGRANAFDETRKGDLALGVYKQLLKVRPDDGRVLRGTFSAATKYGLAAGDAITDLVMLKTQDGIHNEDLVEYIKELAGMGCPERDIAESLSNLSPKYPWAGDVLAVWISDVFLDQPKLAKNLIQYFEPNPSLNAVALLDVADVCRSSGDLMKCKETLFSAFQSANGTPAEGKVVQQCLNTSKSIDDSSSSRLYRQRQWALLAEAGEFKKLTTECGAWCDEQAVNISDLECAADLLSQNEESRSLAQRYYVRLLSHPSVLVDVDRVRWVLKKALALPGNDEQILNLYSENQRRFSLTGVKLQLPSDDRPLKGVSIVLIGSSQLRSMKSDVQSILDRNGAKTRWFMYDSSNRVDQEALAFSVKAASFTIFHLAGGHAVSNVVKPILEASGADYVLIQDQQGQSTVLRCIESKFCKLQR